MGNTHEVVRRVAPDARVVYVDNDPMVLAYGKALLGDDQLLELAMGEEQDGGGGDLVDVAHLAASDPPERQIARRHQDHGSLI